MKFLSARTLLALSAGTLVLSFQNCAPPSGLNAIQDFDSVGAVSDNQTPAIELESDEEDSSDIGLTANLKDAAFSLPADFQFRFHESGAVFYTVEIYDGTKYNGKADSGFAQAIKNVVWQVHEIPAASPGTCLSQNRDAYLYLLQADGLRSAVGARTTNCEAYDDLDPAAKAELYRLVDVLAASLSK